MMQRLYVLLKGLVFPYLKITETAPSIPAGHEHDAHLQVIRADERYWQLVLVGLGAYTASWLGGMLAAGVFFLLVLPSLVWLEIPVLLFAFVKMLIVLAVHRIDYELRWYVITDTSVTVREGAWTVREITASYQNVQNVRVVQGPLERLFGIANVQIDTAGSGGAHGKGEYATGHRCVIRGVRNAHDIRDGILNNLRLYRNAGLGDPDDTHHMDYAPSSRTEVLAQIVEELRTVRGLITAR